DRLVALPVPREVVARPQPRGQETLLGGGDVLELVDDEAAVAVPELLSDRRDLLQQVRHVPQQVVEVEQSHRAGDLEILVGAERVSDLRRREDRKSTRL